MDPTETDPTPAFTIPSLCRLVGISTPTYYKLRAEGRGPREMRMSGTIVRISAAAAREWMEQLESDPADEQRARLKRRSQIAVAGLARGDRAA